METNVKELISYIKKDLKTNGVKLVLSKSYQVKVDNFKCSGFYSSNTKLIKVATKKPLKDWVSTLIHEYCHFRQDVENSEVWKNYIESPVELYSEWLDSEDQWDPYKELSMKLGVIATQALELDCEKRSVEMIKQFNLEPIINVEEYTKKAIAYVLYYQAMLRSRSWYKTHKEPYQIPEAWSQMPSTFENLELDDETLVDIVFNACCDKNVVNGLKNSVLY